MNIASIKNREQDTFDSAANVTRTSTVAVLSAALSACGGGGGGASSISSSGGTTSNIGDARINVPSGYAYVNPVTQAEAARFLLQAQFSATDAEITAVMSLGYKGWLGQQMATGMNPNATAWQWLNAQGYNKVNSSQYYFQYYPADYAMWNQLLASSDGLRKRITLALSEMMVVSLNGSLDFDWRSHAIAFYWDTLAVHAFGNWRDLIEAVTLSPMMGWYLNTKGNKKENPARGQLPDENYAREVMQLFTIGLSELNMDGTQKLQGGVPIDTYDASDISNLAKVFTGYDFDYTGYVKTDTTSNTSYTTLPMKQVGNNFSQSDKSFLNTTISGSTSAAEALKTTLDLLFNHANTAPFFAKQMIQRLVTSNPSPAYVQRVAQVFVSNTAGVRGDLASVFAAILLDDEARSPAGLTDPQFGKIREPIVRFTQWAKTFKATSSTGTWKISDLSDPGYRLGQSPMRSPSVFNFFRPGYAPSATTLAAGNVAPEMQIVNETTVSGYLNFMKAAIGKAYPPGLPVLTGGVQDIAPDYTSELNLVMDPAGLIDRLNLLLCAGQLSQGTRDSFVAQLTSSFPLTESSSAALKSNRVYAAILMVMASAEYIVQK